MSVDQLGRIHVYLVVFCAVAMLLVLWVLPGLIAALTPIGHREILDVTKDALMIAFTIGSLFVVLPILTEAGRSLLDKHALTDADSEHLPEVIGWHARGLVPLGEALTGDPRCNFVEGDFFGLMRAEAPQLDPDEPQKKYHAILDDIDHSPTDLLHSDHGGFYYPEGLQRLTRHIHPGGVFALWSADPSDEDFISALGDVFVRVASHAVNFHNPLLDREVLNTIYVARVSR